MKRNKTKILEKSVRYIGGMRRSNTLIIRSGTQILEEKERKSKATAMIADYAPKLLEDLK